MRVFILIFLFLVGCIFFTRWYLCDIRGLCSYPGDQFTGDKTLAILQITLMLLIAFLLGFGVSWILREKVMVAWRTQYGHVVSDKQEIQSQKAVEEKENDLLRKHLAGAHEELRAMEGVLMNQAKISDELKKSLASSLEDTQQGARRYENLKAETDAMRAEIRSLKERPSTLKRTTEVFAPAGKNIILESRFTPTTWQTRDDLLLIRGIGPVIQKKLMEMGIYSFKQISEFTEEDIARITKAIHFFPGRIRRDDWPGQAHFLMARK